MKYALAGLLFLVIAGLVAGIYWLMALDNGRRPIRSGPHVETPITPGSGSKVEPPDSDSPADRTWQGKLEFYAPLAAHEAVGDEGAGVERGDWLVSWDWDLKEATRALKWSRDVADLDLLHTGFGLSSDDLEWEDVQAADLTGDGVIDGSDSYAAALSYGLNVLEEQVQGRRTPDESWVVLPCHIVKSAEDCEASYSKSDRKSRQKPKADPADPPAVVRKLLVDPVGLELRVLFITVASLRPPRAWTQKYEGDQVVSFLASEVRPEYWNEIAASTHLCEVPQGGVVHYPHLRIASGAQMLIYRDTLDEPFAVVDDLTRPWVDGEAKPGEAHAYYVSCRLQGYETALSIAAPYGKPVKFPTLP